MTMRTMTVRGWWTSGAAIVAMMAAGSRAFAMDGPAKKANGERVLRKEVVVDAPLDRVWQAWTTPEGIAEFFCPDSKIELEIGGAYALYMNMKEPDESGGRGSEGCKLLSYIPREMLSFEWTFPPKVMSLRRAHEKTHVVLRFEPLEDGKTRVRFAQAGWMEGEDWDAGYAYFDKAWANVMKQLKERVKGGETDGEAQSGGKSWVDKHVTVTSITSPLKRQDFEMTIPAPVKKVWNILATREGLKTLGGKDPQVELKPGGAFALWPGANNRVLSYVPNEMLSISGSAPPQFPNVRKGGTWGAYFIEKVDEKTTKLRLSCIGWRPGEKEWDDAFNYFLKANPQFLNGVYSALTSSASADAGEILRHEVIVDAPAKDVWAALTTKEGVESWMVAHADIDLRVGGKMLTHYSPDAVIGDPNTIENTILSFEPERMISIKATKPPANFPMKEAIKSMWTVVRLEPVSDRQTRVTCTSMDFSEDEESQKLRAHFETGNEWTLRKLQKKFAGSHGADATASVDDEATDFRSYAAHIAAAEASFRLNELAEARRWMEAAPEPMRNWEWKQLRALLDDSLWSIDAHKDGMMSVAMSSDGERFVTGGNDSLVKIWDAATGKELVCVKGHTAPIFGVAFSPDGTLVASSSQDRTARIWDAKTGEQVLIYKGHKNPVPCVVFSPDGKRVASCCYEVLTSSPLQIDGEVHLWDPSSRGEAALLVKLSKGGNKPISSLAWSPDGTKMIAGSWNGHVYVWDLAIGDSKDPIELGLPEEGLYNAVNAVAVSPDGQLLAAGSKDRTARVWSLETHKPVATLQGHNDFVNAVGFSPDGSKLVTGGGDDCLRLWNARTWKESAVLRGHRQDVQSVCWTPRGDTMVSASLDGTVRAWDPNYPHYGGMKLKQADACYAALFSPDGKQLYTCGYDGSISIWGTTSGERIAHWIGHPGSSVNTLGLSADGRRLLSVSWDKTAKVWDAQTQAEIAALRNEVGIYHGAISPDGRLVACSQKKIACVWDVDKNQVKFNLEGHEGGIQSVAFSPDGSMIATSAGDKSVRTWDATTGKSIAVMNGHHGGIESAVFNPDGTMVASGSADGSIRLWNAKTGEQIRVLYDGDDNIYRVAFSPDGSRVAAGGNRCLILDVVHGGTVAALRPNPDGVWHLSFSPDGTRLATAGWDKSIRILDTRPVRELLEESGRPASAH